MDSYDDEVTFKPREERLKEIRRRRKGTSSVEANHTASSETQAVSKSVTPRKSRSRPLSERSMNLTDIDEQLADLKEAVENLERDLTADDDRDSTGFSSTSGSREILPTQKPNSPSSTARSPVVSLLDPTTSPTHSKLGAESATPRGTGKEVPSPSRSHVVGEQDCKSNQAGPVQPEEESEEENISTELIQESKTKAEESLGTAELEVTKDEDSLHLAAVGEHEIDDAASRSGTQQEPSAERGGSSNDDLEGHLMSSQAVKTRDEEHGSNDEFEPLSKTCDDHGLDEVGDGLALGDSRLGDEGTPVSLGSDSHEDAILHVAEIAGLDDVEFGMYTETEVEAERRKAASAAESELAILGSRLEATRLELEAERQETGKLREEFVATVEKMSALSTAGASEEVTRLQTENARLREDLKVRSDAFDSLKARYGKFKEAVIKYDSQEKELIAQIRTLRNSLGELENWNRDFKAHAEKKLQDAFAQVCSHKSQLKAKSTEVDNLATAKISLEQQARLSSEAREQALQERDRLEAEVKTMGESARKASSLLEKEIELAKSQAKQHKADLSIYIEENNQLKVRIFDSMQSMERLEQQVQQLKKEEQNSKQEQSQLGQPRNIDASDRIQALEAENVDLKSLCEELLVKLEDYQEVRT